jgi:hypothetical protein
MFSKILETQTGSSRLKNLIIILFLAGVVYLGYKFIPVYIDYYRVKNLFAAELNTARDMPIEFIEGNIKRKIEEHSLPVPPEAVNVEQEENTIRIYATYSVEVKLPLDYSVELEFSPYVEKEFR